MNRNMKKVYEVFKDNPDFQVVCITSMPESDSVARLKRYGDSLKLNPKNWVLLTARKDSLYKAARVSYLLDDPKLPLNNIEDQFIHTQFFALVDKNGEVRGQVYDGLKEPEIERLINDVRKLLKEKQGKGNAPNLFRN
jgi:protein SCO1